MDSCVFFFFTVGIMLVVGICGSLIGTARRIQGRLSVLVAVVFASCDTEKMRESESPEANTHFEKQKQS
jgi:hypothetical protein